MSQSVFEENSLIWIDGQFVKYKDATCVHIASHSLHYSSSIFEGIISFDGKVFELPRHVDRFFNSAETLGINLDLTKQTLIDAISQVIQENNYVSGLYYVRPLAWRDVEDATIKGYKDAKAHIAIMSRRLFNSLNKDILPINLLLSSWKKAPRSCLPYDCKGSGNYLIPILSKQEARNKGLDDALLVDCDGLIAEAGSANSFFVKEKTLFTPYTTHCLNGITRQNIIKLAKDNGYSVVEANIFPDEIENFDELFLTGTAVGVLSVASVTLSTKTKVEFKKFDTTNAFKQMYKERVISF
jgi:branched-chain amino acid aminotransferase